MLVGLAGLVPQAWVLPWIGVALIAWALSVEESRVRAVLGLVVGGVVVRACWFAWGPAMAAALWAGDPTMRAAATLGFPVLEALPVVAILSGFAVVLHGRPALIRFWLPVGWTIGERVQARWTSIASDWVFTQLEFRPIMEALRALGMVPLTLLCLFAAASVGEGLALRRKDVVGIGVAVALALGLAPPIPDWDPGVLEGVGAVHMPDIDHVPAADRVDGLELVVWPEASFHIQPPVAEGPVQGVRLDAAPGGPDTSHLLGVRTPARYGRQNMALAVRPDGVVTQARAKIGLLPIMERPFLGLGGPGFVPGTAVPLLEVAGRRVVTVICGELLQRDVVSRGVQAGADLLVVMASDRFQGGSALADRHVLVKLRLRAIEYGLPAVYASIHGRASFVSPRGEVLARSAADAPAGVLTWTLETGPRDHQPSVEPSVVQLYSERTPHLKVDCRPGRCAYHTLEQSECDDTRSKTVIVSAHGDGTEVGGLSPEELAARVACFEPELVVLDVCFGASVPVLRALEARTEAVVVGVPAFVAARGLRYTDAFYGTGSAEERAAAVHTEPPSPLFVGRPGPDDLAAAEAWVAGADGDTLRPQVRSWVPTLVAAELDSGQRVLVPADWERIGHPPATLR